MHFGLSLIRYSLDYLSSLMQKLLTIVLPEVYLLNGFFQLLGAVIGRHYEVLQTYLFHNVYQGLTDILHYAYDYLFNVYAPLWFITTG